MILNGWSKARRAASCLLAGAATAAFVSPAAAQPEPAADRAAVPDRVPEPQALSPGATVNGSLQPTDGSRAGRYYDSYRLRLDKGESVQIDMASSAFDSFLDVTAPGESDETLRENDDGIADSLNARLRFTAPEAGDYLVRAQGLEQGTGAYTLAVTRRIVAPPPAPIRLSAGNDVTGRFDENSPELDDGKPYALYTFEGRAGARLRIDMLSEGLDPAVKLTRDGGGEAFSAEDDDGGDGLNARLFTVLPASGRYTITARNVNDKSGTYSLKLQQFQPPPGPPPPPRALRREAPILDRLAFDDAELRLGTDDKGAVSYFYKLYTLPVAAGETVTVDFKSEAFDPVLDAGVMSFLGFAVAKSNDDTEGTNARLVLTPTQSGTVYLRARSLNAGAMGDYTLSVTTGAAARR
jgi:hypothetical protein